MLVKKKNPKALSLWEKVSLGIDIGVDTSKDLICTKCWLEDKYTQTATDMCPVHGQVDTLPEWVVEKELKYHGKYEQKLIWRTKVNRSIQVFKKEEQELNRMKQIVRAGMVGQTANWGKWTDAIVALVANDAMRFGLAPGVEIFPYIKTDRQNNIIGVTTGINYKGLEKLARRQADFVIPDDQIRILSAEEVEERRLHLVPGYVNKKPKPDEVIVAEVPLYRLDIYEKQLDLAAKAKEVGNNPLPVGPTVVGHGIWRPGDSIPAGRTAEWRAKLRGMKDAISKAYDLSYEITTRYIEPQREEESSIFVVDEEDEMPTMSVDEIMGELVTSEMEEETGNSLPGELLNDNERNLFIKRVKEYGFGDGTEAAQVVAASVFGGDFKLSWLTKIAGRNLVEYMRRSKLLSDGDAKPSDFGYDDDMDTQAVKEALRQDCKDASFNGYTWDYDETN